MKKVKQGCQHRNLQHDMLHERSTPYSFSCAWYILVSLAVLKLIDTSDASPPFCRSIYSGM